MSFALNVIAKASILLLAAAASSILFRRASAAARHAVWVLAIVGAVLIPFVAAVVPELQLPIVPEGHADVRLIPVATQTEAPVAHSGVTASTPYTLQNGLIAIWAAGMFLLLMRIVTATFRVSRLAKSAHSAEDESWAHLVEEISESLECRKPVRVLFSTVPVSPMTWGFRRHTVLLPSSANDWDGERRRLVLAHELAHVKRNDGIVQLFLQFVCSIYWFNPLIWYAAHRVRIERERACDDQVLNLGGAAEDYADHLVQIARGLRISVSFAAVAMAQPSQLETRLLSILDATARRRGISRPALVSLCAAAALITISVAAIGVTSAVPLPPLLAVATKPVLQPAMPEMKTAPAPPQRTHIGNSSTPSPSTVVPPQVIASGGPLYAEVEGTVTLEALVDAHGNARVLRVTKGIDDSINQRAIDAVMNWKFAPALKDGVPATAVTQIDVDFTLPPDSGPFRVGRGVTPPSVLSRVEPQYTDEARSAHAGGTVALEAVIRKDGTADILRVLQSVGYGLDESAMQALTQWVFKPGTRNGVPVDVALKIEVNFNLK
jgi:TonB family protein